MDPNKKFLPKRLMKSRRYVPNIRKSMAFQHPLPLTFLQKVNMQWFRKGREKPGTTVSCMTPSCSTLCFFRLVLTFFDLKFPLFSKWPLVPQCGKWPMAGVVTVQRQDTGRVTPMSCSANWREGSPFISLSGKQLDKRTVTKHFRYLKWRCSPI